MTNHAEVQDVLRNVRAVWVHMIAIFGSRWSSAFGESPHRDDGEGLTVAGQKWAAGLAGFTTAQVKAGAQRALMGPERWPPSLPEFRGLCLGVPSLARVKADLRAGLDSPWTRGSRQYVDSYRLRNASVDTSDRLLNEAYALMVEDVFDGKPLPPPLPAGIPENPRREYHPAPPDLAEAHMREIMETLGCGE